MPTQPWQQRERECHIRLPHRAFGSGLLRKSYLQRKQTKRHRTTPAAGHPSPQTPRCQALEEPSGTLQHRRKKPPEAIIMSSLAENQSSNGLWQLQRNPQPGRAYNRTWKFKTCIRTPGRGAGAGPLTNSGLPVLSRIGSAWPQHCRLYRQVLRPEAAHGTSWQERQASDLDIS